MSSSRSDQESAPVGLLISALFIIGVLLRAPGFFQETGAFTFCDENMFLKEALRMYLEGDPVPSLYHSGAINFYLPMIAAQLSELFTGSYLTVEQFRIAARFLSAGILSSLSAVFIFLAANSLFKKQTVAIFCSLLMLFSPFVLANSRYHYPDHYIMFFICLSLWCCAKLMESDADRQSILWYAIAGLSAALAASVKYTGALLCVQIFLAWIFSTWRKPQDVNHLISLLRPLVVAAMSAAVGFMILNPGMFLHPDAFLSGLAVSHYSRSETPWQGWIYLGKLLLFLPFGVLTALVSLVGLISLIRVSGRKLVLLIFLPLTIVLWLGSYEQLLPRNVVIALPSMALLAGYGFHVAGNWLKNRQENEVNLHQVLLLLGLILLIEPVTKSLHSLKRDFDPDARLMARSWSQLLLSEEYPRVFSHFGCDYDYLVPPNPVTNDRSCPDYVVLDTWFGGVDSLGRQKHFPPSLANIVSELDQKRLHYKDHTEMWFMLGQPADVLSGYDIAYKFEGFGPDVLVFERKAPCIVR